MRSVIDWISNIPHREICKCIASFRRKWSNTLSWQIRCKVHLVKFLVWSSSYSFLSLCTSCKLFVLSQFCDFVKKGSSLWPQLRNLITFVWQALTALEQKRRFALATVSTRREEAGKLEWVINTSVLLCGGQKIGRCYLVIYASPIIRTSYVHTGEDSIFSSNGCLKHEICLFLYVTLMGGHGCREYFEDVNSTRVKFEQTLWGHIRNFFQLAKERCLSQFPLIQALSWSL